MNGEYEKPPYALSLTYQNLILMDEVHLLKIRSYDDHTI